MRLPLRRLARPRLAFISYRRGDFTAARHVYDWAVRRYGRKRVFLDHEDNVGADRWADHVEEAVRRSRAMVAVVGPAWVARAGDLAAAEGEQDPESPSLANRDADWVRRELVLAAGAGVPIRPFYYLADPDMPRSLADVDEMPPEIATILTEPQVVTGRPDQFTAGLAQLGRALDPVMGAWSRRRLRLPALAVVAAMLVAGLAWLGCRVAGCWAPGEIDPGLLGIVVTDDFGGASLGGDERRLADALAAEVEAAFAGAAGGVEVRVGGRVQPDGADGGSAAAEELAASHGADAVIGGVVETAGTRTSLRPVAYLGALPDLEELQGRKLELAFAAGSTNADIGERGALDDLVGGLQAGFAPLAGLLEGAHDYRFDRLGDALAHLEPVLDDLSGLEGAIAEQLTANMHAVFGDYDAAERHHLAALGHATPFPRAEMGVVEARFLAAIEPAGCAGADPGRLAELGAAAGEIAASLAAGPGVLRAKAHLLEGRLVLCEAQRSGVFDTPEVRSAATRLAALVGTPEPPDELNEAVVVASRTLAALVHEARVRGETGLAAHLLDEAPVTAEPPDAALPAAERLAALQEAVLTLGICTTHRPLLRADAYLDRGNLRFDLGKRGAARYDYEAARLDVEDLLAGLRGNEHAQDDGFEQALAERAADLGVLIADVGAEPAETPCPEG